MYISADTFENDTWQKALIHEYTHLEEGSEEYFKLCEFLQSDDILVDAQTDTGTQKIPLWKKAQSAVYGKNYGFEKNKIKDIQDKIDNGQEISAEEIKLYKAFVTEVAAHETEYLLGNEAFIDKIVAKDASFAKRIMKKIADLKKAFEKSGETKSKAEIKQLEQAEKLYLAAAEKAGGARLQDYIMGREPEEEESVDTEDNTRYSLSSNAESDIETALNNIEYREDIKLTVASPAIIVNQKGVRDLPMLMKASHIRENIFTEEEAKALGLKVDKHTHYHGLEKNCF